MKRVSLYLYRVLQRIVSLSGWTFQIFRSKPKKKWVEIFVPSVHAWMRLDMRESLDASYAQNQVDDSCISFIKSCGENEFTFVDVGANQGFYSLLALIEFPSARVVAIEPDPYSLEKLRKNLELNDINSERIHIVGKAAGTSKSEIELMINDVGNRAGSSVILDQRQYTSKATNTIVKVHTESLYEILLHAEILHVSCMKLDIEGFEFPVLNKFFQQAPKNMWPKFFVIEAMGRLIAITGGSPINLLFGHGYELVNHDEYNYMFAKKND